MTRFLRHLGQRKVVQWALAYMAVSLALLEASNLVKEEFGWPDGLMRGLIVLLAVGVVATIIIAWYHGEKGAQQVSAVELLMLTALATIAAGVLWIVQEETEANAAAAPVSLASPAADTMEIGSLAVLAFTDYGGDERSTRLSDAIHDEVLARLAQIPNLILTSRTSVMALRQAPRTMRQIADTLGVRYVLEASVTHGTGVIKVIAQLIDPLRDTHIWVDQHEFPTADLFTLQENVASWLTARLLNALPGVRSPEMYSRARDADAFNAYLNGKYWLNSRKQEDLARAIAAFEETIQRDPEFAPAFAAAAVAYGLWGTYGYGGPYATYEAYGRAVHLADRAVELDPNLGEAHSARAYLLNKAFGPADTVASEFGRALELLPSSAEIRILHASFLAREGRFEESLVEAELAVRLDPLAPGRDAGLGWDALAAGQPAIALRSAERANVLEPELLTPRVIRAFSLVLLDRAEECHALDLGRFDAVRAICLHATGKTRDAIALIDSIVANPSPGTPLQHLASYFAWTGDPERSLEALRQSFETTPHGLDFRVLSSGVFSAVLADPRFSRGLNRLRREVWNRVERARAAARTSSP